MALDNIYTRMKKNWEYRGSKKELKVLRYEVFKSDLGQQLKNKKAQVKMRILKGMENRRLSNWIIS